MPPPPASHAAFRRPVDPTAARLHMRVSLVVVAGLSLAVGLCMSALAPHAGWILGVPSLFSSSGIARSFAG